MASPCHTNAWRAFRWDCLPASKRCDTTLAHLNCLGLSRSTSEKHASPLPLPLRAQNPNCSFATEGVCTASTARSTLSPLSMTIEKSRPDSSTFFILTSSPRSSGSVGVPLLAPGRAKRIAITNNGPGYCATAPPHKKFLSHQLVTPFNSRTEMKQLSRGYC